MKKSEYFQTNVIRFVLLSLLVVIVFGTIVGCAEDYNFQKEYSQSDIVTYKDVNFSITNVVKTRGSNKYFQAKKGYEYVKVSIKIENNSDKKISYNALDFQMVNGDGVEASFYSITAEDDVLLGSGELDSGGKVEGVIIWEQKKDDPGLRVRFYNNVLFDDDYTFQWTLD